MSARKGQGSTLGIAIAVAVLIVGLVVVAASLVRLPKKAPAVEPSKSSGTMVVVKRVDADNALYQQVELYDPKPLFLPTEINNSDPALPSSLRREPGSVFKAIPPRLTFAEYEMKVELPEPIAVPAGPVQALRVGEEPLPYHGMGYINYPYTPLSSRLAYLEVLQARTGKVVLSAPLTAAAGERLPSVDWKPLEMVVAVEAYGLVGEPAITTGSDSEEVDNFFRTLISKEFNLGARLAPGFYTLRVGP
jgi:hypothetical protein